MRQYPAFADPDRSPRPYSPEAAAAGLERLDEALRAFDDDNLAHVASEILNDTPRRQLFAAVVGNSPFLARCLEQDIGTALAWCKDGPDAVMAALLSEAQAAATQSMHC